MTSTSAYDLVPYESRPFAQSQPEQLAVIAQLFGLAPPPPSQARVLELGCAAGGNLIPLAARYPQASFIGIDSAATQVEQAQQTVRALALTNIEIRHQSVADALPEAAPFDYIICHGVYSWVTPDMQEAILRACRAHLAQQGVAYISYNTYPGWKMREVVRDTMMYHTQALAQPQERMQQARAILQFVQEVSDERNAFGKLLREEAAVVAKSADYYLYHDYLATDNRPCYFREFMERAHAHELGYLGEALLADMAPQRHGDKIFSTVQKLSNGNILATEQYMDFFRNRSFRRTLLVHQACLAQVRRNISPDGLRQFFFTSSFLPTRAAVPESVEELEFRQPSGAAIKTAMPLLKALLLSLAGAFPRPLGYADVLAAVKGRLHTNAKAEPDLSNLNDHLVRFVVDNVVQLHLEVPQMGRAGDNKPRAFGPARLAAERGATVQTNWRHESVALNLVEAQLLALIDGHRTHDELKEIMVERAAKRGYTLMKDNIQLTDPQEIWPIVNTLVADSLLKFEKLALLA